MSWGGGIENPIGAVGRVHDGTDRVTLVPGLGRIQTRTTPGGNGQVWCEWLNGTTQAQWSRVLMSILRLHRITARCDGVRVRVDPEIANAIKLYVESPAFWHMSMIDFIRAVAFTEES